MTITGEPGSLRGLFDMASSSVTRRMQDVVYENGRLTFVVERLYDAISVDVAISGDELAGEMIFRGDERVPMEGTRVPGPSGTVIDHAAVIRSLDGQTLQEGERLYEQVCAACHGADGTSSLPAARSFNRDAFRYGSDPYSMWRTTTEGAGQMGAQRWLSPEAAYAVVQYIREELVKEDNPGMYFEVTEDYLEGLPEPSMSPEELDRMIEREALSGSQEYGQLYFTEHLGDYGRAIYSSLDDRANATLLVELAGDVYVAYNPQRMSVVAAWRGGLDLSETKFQLYRGEGEPIMDGQELAGMERMHWSYQDRYGVLDNLVSDRTPFPDEWLTYHGHYQHGEDVVLSYAIMGRDVLEMPSAHMLEGVPVVRHTLAIAPGDSWRKIVLGGLGDRDSETAREGVFPLTDADAPEGLDEEAWGDPHRSLAVTALEEEDGRMGAFFAVGVEGDTEGMRWVVEGTHRLALRIPPSERAQTIRIHRFSGEGEAQYLAFAGYLSEMRDRPIPEPADYTRGGRRVWGETVVTRGQLDAARPHYDPVHYGEPDQDAPESLVRIPDRYPYTVDRITLPFDNPWGSWIRPTGFDFFPDGRAVLSTYAGDVWMAEGIDDDLAEIRWRRIATGLYDPMGVKVKDGEIYVICRDRIMRLVDLDGDGETDFYESFFADTDVSDVPVQAYNFSLETDSRGNFLYAKAGQYTNNDEPGNLIRVTPDGTSQESVAIGFRAPNGITVDPWDRIFVSDNQGTWMPANKISLIEEGGFYGFVPSVGYSNNGAPEYRMRPPLSRYPADGAVLPLSFDEPIVWMPQAFDNSPGNGAWTPEAWGPLGDRLVWTSFGKGWAYQVLMDEVDGTVQAAVSALPFQFDSGTQRAAVNPADGQFYLAGVTGWDDAFAQTYGSFDRIRYTGGEGFVLDAVQVRPAGVALTFNQALNPDVATRPGNYTVKQWNYRWDQRYGSEDWSVRNPEETGQDDVPVLAVELSEDGRTILMEISEGDLQPVDQMRIELTVESADGGRYSDTIYLTIHEVPGREPSPDQPLQPQEQP